MADIMQDPELMAAMQNPKVMAALQGAMGGNPGALQAAMGDPEVGPVLQKLMAKFGGGMGGMPGMGGMGGMPGMGGMGFLEEEGSDEDDDEIGAIQIDDIPQAFSHFSYEYSRGRQLVCDLQGVWNADDGFMLTDPVIHHVCSEGRRHMNGATDKGEAGVKKFFETHVCNALCKRMELTERAPDTLISGSLAK
jgi:hypothetical protein